MQALNVAARTHVTFAGNASQSYRAHRARAAGYERVRQRKSSTDQRDHCGERDRLHGRRHGLEQR